MSVYIVTGRLGAGKSLLAVARVESYALEGRRVAANFPIDLTSICRFAGSKMARCSVTVIPDRPAAQDLEALGIGGESEDRAGLLVLDECATFLNARSWAVGGRDNLVTWFLHSRKLKWDLMLLVQHQSMLDKQVREALGEHLVTIRRADKFRIPVISWFVKLRLPRVHIGQVRYGMAPGDPIADWWFARGNRYFACYSTDWISTVGGGGSYCMVPPWHQRFRYLPKRDLVREVLEVLGGLLVWVLLRLICCSGKPWAQPREVRLRRAPVPRSGAGTAARRPSLDICVNGESKTEP